MYDEKTIKELIDNAKAKDKLRGDGKEHQHEDLLRMMLNKVNKGIQQPLQDCCNIIYRVDKGLREGIKEQEIEGIPPEVSNCIAVTLRHQLMIGILGNAMEILNIPKDHVENMLIEIVKQHKNIQAQRKEE